ncbi:META domain-containing protein [Chitinophaga lutea]
MKQWFLSGTALLLLAIVACQGPGKQTGQDTAAASTPAMATSASTGLPLQGTRWKLKEIPGNPSLPISGANEPYMILSDTSAQVRGQLGCNGFGAQFLATETGDLQFTQLVSTQMACPQLEAENAFSKALEVTTRFVIEKDVLRLQKGDSVVATFTGAQP